MKILCCGDSWTWGWGVQSSERWTSMIPNAIVENVALPGQTNFQIRSQLFKNINSEFDIVIIGWSGVTRYHYQDLIIDFCVADEFNYRNNFFDNKTLKSIEDDFIELNHQVNDLCEKNKIKKLIKFSVFGDFKYLWDEFYTDQSFLDFLSANQGNFFNHDIPFFEFDFLSEINYKNTTKFCNKYFKKNWEKAIIERNSIYPGKYFLPCGHPNEQGHTLWAEYIKKYL